MAFDFTKGNDACNGFGVDGGAGFYSGSGTPVGDQAPIGSIYTDVVSGRLGRKSHRV